MPPETPDILFEFSTSARADGSLEAAYIRLRQGDVAYTKEIHPDTLLADYDQLLGIEILAPVTLADLDVLIEPTRREPFKRFVQQSAPRELVSA